MCEIFGIDLPWLLDASVRGSTSTQCVRKRTSLAVWKLIIRTVICHAVPRRRLEPLGLWRRMSSAPKPCGTLEVFGEGLHLFWEGRTPGRCTATTPKPGRRNLWTPHGSFEHDARYKDNIVENAMWMK